MLATPSQFTAADLVTQRKTCPGIGTHLAQSVINQPVGKNWMLNGMPLITKLMRMTYENHSGTSR